MDNVRYTSYGNELVLSLIGRIDANNAKEVEEAALSAIKEHPCDLVIFDFERLTYLSSAGLRVILRLAKQVPDVRIVNASSEVYDVLEMTGFTELFKVTKAFRRISLEGCDLIGSGSKGKVYRIDPETVVKVCEDTSDDALAQLARERKLARTAFVLGIPTAISYEVVRVAERYGAVYELLDASSLRQLVADGSWSVEHAAFVTADLIAQFHETHAKPGSLPNARDIQLDDFYLLKGNIPNDLYSRIIELTESIPDDDRLIHGDFHVGNIMIQDGDPLLIDLDTLSQGNAALELGPIYNAYVGFGELDHSITEEFLGFPYEVSNELWSLLISRYAKNRGLDEASITLKAEALGRARQLRRVVAHQTLATELGQKVMEHNVKHLQQLLPAIDTFAI